MTATAIVKGISEAYVTALLKCSPSDAWEELQRHRKQVGSTGPFAVKFQIGAGTMQEQADFNLKRPRPLEYRLERRRGYWLATWTFSAA